MSRPEPTSAFSRTRLAQGLSANLIATALRIGSQLATLPILFAFLQPADVGLWSMLWVVPSTLVIAAQGFATAGASAALLTAGDPQRAAALYRTTARVAALTTAGCLILAVLIMEGVLRWTALNALPVSPTELRQVVLVLGLNALLAAGMASLEVPLRFAGRYPAFILFGSVTAAAELLGVALALALGGGFLAMAVALTVARALICIVAIWRTRCWAGSAMLAGRRLPIEPLMAPAVGFMLLPVVYVINLQGYVLLIGATYGTAVLASFVASRMLARLFDLLAALVFNSAFYEAAHLSDAQRSRLPDIAAAVILAVLLAGGGAWLALMLLGSLVQRAWTLGETVFDPLIATLLLGGCVLRAVAAFPAAVLASRNDHLPLCAGYLALSATGLAGAIGCTWLGAPIAVVLLGALLVEGAYAWLALHTFLRETSLSGGAFLRRIFTRESAALLHRSLWQRRLHSANV